MRGAVGGGDRREAEDLEQLEAQGNRPFFYFNGPLSKQFIELYLQNEHHISYYNKGENVLKLRLDHEMRGEIFEIVKLQIAQRDTARISVS